MHSNNITAGAQPKTLQTLISQVLNGERCEASFSDSYNSESLFQVNPFSNPSVLTPFRHHGINDPLPMVTEMLLGVFSRVLSNSFGISTDFQADSPAAQSAYAQAKSMVDQDREYGSVFNSGFTRDENGFGSPAMQIAERPCQALTTRQPAVYTEGCGHNNAVAQQSFNSSRITKDSARSRISSGGCPFLQHRNSERGSSSGNSSNAIQSNYAADNHDTDLTNSTAAQQSETDLSVKERAILHLWGRQMISAGKQDGGIYSTVLGADRVGSGWSNKTEVELVKELRSQEQEIFGGDTGFMLDEAFFQLHASRTGENLSARYKRRRIHFSQGPIDIANDVNTAALNFKRENDGVNSSGVNSEGVNSCAHNRGIVNSSIVNSDGSSNSTFESVLDSLYKN